MMFVSSYDKAFRDAFAETLSELDPEPFEASVKKIVDRLAEDVVDRVHDDVRDRMISAIGDSICAKAAEVATRMLESALAGDDKTLRDLFSFYRHPEGSLAHHSGFAPTLTRWRLIEAMIERRPDLFIDERIDQLNETMIALKRDKDRLQKTARWYRDLHEGRDAGPHP